MVQKQRSYCSVHYIALTKFNNITQRLLQSVVKNVSIIYHLDKNWSNNLPRPACVLPFFWMTGCLPGCCKVDRLAKLMSAVTCVIAILHESKVNKTTQSDVHLFKDTGHMFTFCFIAAFNKYEQKISKFVPSISSHRNVFMFSIHVSFVRNKTRIQWTLRS